MKKSLNSRFILLLAVALIATWSGCRSRRGAVDEVLPPPVADADTTFREAAPFATVDTTDDAVFREAQLAEEVARRARELLTPVHFDFNSFQLSPRAVEQLSSVVTFLNDYPHLRLLIEGHCDERGSSEYNIGLGERRARAVREYLVNYGIQAIRFETTSFGKERPAQPYCTDDACHSRNRRAEFKVLAQ